MYKIILRPLFFLFQPETIHRVTHHLLKFLFALPFTKNVVRARFVISDKQLNKKLFGLTFKNPVGLAAGFDKNAALFGELENFGFGFIEIGTVTPMPQSGNPKPRIFRIPKDKGLINRMGFNNHGMLATVEKLKKSKSKIIIGGNIGKNTLTPNESAVSDYEQCFETLFPYVDYFAVNVSCPNVAHLQKLSDKPSLLAILNRIQTLNNKKQKRKPILLKIAPDLNTIQLNEIIEVVQETKIDGIIASNTTTTRDNLITKKEKIERIANGGLSGEPVKNKATETIRYLAQKSNKTIPIIGVGGIFTAKDAIEKIDAGADLIQVYTGFIYEGPSIVKNINKALLKK